MRPTWMMLRTAVLRATIPARGIMADRRQRLLATIQPQQQQQPQLAGVKSAAEALREQTAALHAAAATSSTASAADAHTHDNCQQQQQQKGLEQSIRDFLKSTRQRPRAGLKADELLVKCPVCSPGKPRRLAYMAHLNTTSGAFVCTGCFEQGPWEKYQTLASSRNFQNSIPKGKRVTEPAPFEFADATLMRLQQNLVRHEEIFAALTGNEKGQLRLRPDVLARYGVGLGFANPDEPEVTDLEALANGSDHTAPCLVFPRTAFRTNSFIEASSSSSSSGSGGNGSNSSGSRSVSGLSSILRDTRTALRTGSFIEAEGAADEAPAFRVVQLKMVGWHTPDLELFFPVDGAQPGLFGFHVAQPTAGEDVILTGHELDALAAFQATGIPAVSLPRGPYQLPLDAMRALERFERVYVWLDDDHQGAEAARQVARKLGVDRCLVVSTRGANPLGPKSASIALACGADLQQLLDDARPLRHDKVLDFSALREAVKFEVTNPDLIRGVESKDLPGWNACFKGLRPGELTILSGATGCGKTTVISQMSLDFCRSGVSTLWGSFEIPNVRLATRMLGQFARRDISRAPDEVDYWSRKFERLPLYFLKFHGSTQPDAVLETMRHAVYAHDVKHIVIDNLQFMMSMQAKGLDKYDAQDAAIATFRRFATDENVHITVVAHLRKDQPSSDADINSVFGSAKVTQEADNVVILQRYGGASSRIRCVNILKNRFDGTLGKVFISYDADAMSFHEIPAPRRRKDAKVVKPATAAAAARLSMADRIVAEAEMHDALDDGDGVDASASGSHGR
ncbi:hypothetical protein LPJ72_001300 [Coemansia sp. Benny D160-2]|nr:hypothetical protein LPJ72_001300 [Coemansia sp. Benny D160-2]